MTNITNNFKLNVVVYYLILAFPLTYVTGSFLPNLIITSIILLFIYEIFKKKLKILDIKIFSFFLFFWIILVLSSFWAPNFEKAFISGFGYIRFLILPFAMIYFINDIKKFYLDISFVIFVIIVLLGIDIIYQNYFGTDLLGYKSAINGTRNSGFFGEELIAGGFVAKLFFISLIFLIKKKSFYLIIYSLFVILVVFLSGERMSFLYLLLGLFMLPLIFNLKKKIIYFLSLLIFIVLIFNIHEKNKERMYNNFIEIIKYGSYGENGEYYKTEKNNFYIINSGWGAHWLAAINIFLDSPFTGKGLRSFRYICSEKKYETISENDENRCSTHPHNYYLEIAADLGILGLAFLVLFIFFCSIIVLKNKKNDEFLMIKIINLTILFWPIATTGSIFSSYYGSFFWFLLSITIIQGLKKELKV